MIPAVGRSVCDHQLCQQARGHARLHPLRHGVLGVVPWRLDLAVQEYIKASQCLVAGCLLQISCASVGKASYMHQHHRDAPPRATHLAGSSRR